jgi:hypothetical protein
MYMKIINLILLSAALQVVVLQQAYSQYETDTIATRFARTITADELKEHLYTIASDSFGGRDTGSEGLKMAADYLINHYQANQLKGIVPSNEFLQPFPVLKSEWGEPYMLVNGQRFSFIEDFYGFPRMNQSMQAEIETVTFAGYGISSERYDDYAKLDVDGKVIMVLSGEPLSTDSTYFVTGTSEKSRFTANYMTSMRTKQEIASEKGASLVLMVDDNYAANSRRYGIYAQMPSMSLGQSSEPQANLIFISPDMAQAILGKRDLAKIQKKISKKEKTFNFNIKTNLEVALEKNDSTINTANVLAFIEGSDLKNEVLVITSHYDHVGERDGEIYNGADDDGSGTVGVMEIAEAFAEAKSAGFGPRRSILFMNVSGEEKGLLGSDYYTSNPVIPLEQTIANLNIDMIGRIDPAHQETPNYVYVIGSDRLSTELHQINEAANATYTQLILDYKYNAEDDPNRFYYRSDHYNFAKYNIPIVFYFNGVHQDYHQPGDTPDKINYDVLETRTRLVFHTAWQLVNQDKRIEVDVSGE